MMRGKMGEEILAKLNLTAAQKTKWDALTKQRRAEMEKMRGTDPSKMDRKAMMEKMKGWQDKFMAVLTPDQQKKYKALAKEAMEKWQKDHPGGPGGAGGFGGREGGAGAGGAGAKNGKGGKKGGGGL